MKTILAGIGVVAILGFTFLCGMITIIVVYGRHPDMGHRHIHDIAEASGVTDTWDDLNPINFGK